MVLDRISTGVSGLDSLIEGGIPRGFTVLVAGNPVTGKTVMTSHFLYNGLQKCENGIYVSFSESKEQFYDNIERFNMDFKIFEKEGKFHFLDFASITKTGIQDALDEILATIRDTNAKRMVIDSFSAIAQSFDNMNEARIALQVVLGKMMRAEGVTNMLIAEVPVGQESIGSGIEEFVADGIIKLEHGNTNAYPMIIRVVKMRGTAVNREPHVAVINAKGMTMFPKQKLQLTFPSSEQRISVGNSGFDQRAGWGLLKGTITALIGASGVGKTTFSFQFVAEGVKNGEPGIYCSLEESPEDIRKMATNYGHDIRTLEQKGLTIVSKVAENQSPDAFTSFLREEIRRTGARRLCVDSLSAFEHSHKDELYTITKRIVSLVREYGVTTIFTILTTQQSGINLTELGISSLFQNIILLRYVEGEGKMKRSMLILKMRATSHDQSILEFRISKGVGIEIVASMENYTGILTGVAQRLHQDYLDKEEAIRQQEQNERIQRLRAFEAEEKEIQRKQAKERELRRIHCNNEIMDIQEKDKEKRNKY